MAREQKTSTEEGKLENAEIKNEAEKGPKEQNGSTEQSELREQRPEEGDEAKAETGQKNIVRYIGKAASYTIGAVRFEPGQTKEIDPAYMDTALESGQFEEV